MNTLLKPSKDFPIAQAVNQALASLLSAWADIGQHDVIVHVNGNPIAVLIPFQDYEALQDEDILQDIRDGREAEAIYQEWLEDPTIARPYAEFRTELAKDTREWPKDTGKWPKDTGKWPKDTQVVAQGHAEMAQGHSGSQSKTPGNGSRTLR